MASIPRPSATELAARIVAQGPHKQEPARRRIRALLGGAWIVDTLDAQYVWEHPYFPVFYLPLASIESGPGKISNKDERGSGFWTASIVSGDQNAEVTVYEKGPLAGFVKITSTEAEWYAEDEKLLGSHPKDPYKRIEILPSARQVRIEVDGTVVAQSDHTMFLFETMLRPRYYMPVTAVRDMRMLTKSNTTTFCPYKGQASYYHITVGDKKIEDAVWYYIYPTQESQSIQGRLCFYNEKFDVFVDGKMES